MRGRRHPSSRKRTVLGVLAAVAAVAPLAAPAPAVADGGVVGGRTVNAPDTPWVVALSSRDRFGRMRAGQFCGGRRHRPDEGGDRRALPARGRAGGAVRGTARPQGHRRPQ
ncbi:hypothetical protein LUX05_18100 [Streptomyces somaliensis]|nr:hypothetical protein [Streptomyces somaliensis]